jgi:hypothetical protein
MPELDERLTRALERSTRTEPAGPEVFDDVVRRRGRRERSRRVQRGALVVAVVAITLGGSLAIRDWVGDNAVPAGQQTNGRILFVRSQSQLHPGGGSSASEFQIWSIDSAGDDLAQLPVGDEGLFAATWSPDGRRIAYLARNENPVDALRPLDLWVVNADGGEPVRWSKACRHPCAPRSTGRLTALRSRCSGRDGMGSTRWTDSDFRCWTSSSRDPRHLATWSEMDRS